MKTILYPSLLWVVLVTAYPAKEAPQDTASLLHYGTLPAFSVLPNSEEFSSPQTKRQNPPRVLNHCPWDSGVYINRNLTMFRGSVCTETTPQTYNIACDVQTPPDERWPPPENWWWGTCFPYEICIQQAVIGVTNPYPLAMCVTSNPLVTIANAFGLYPNQGVTIPISAPNVNTAEIVLLGQTNSSVYYQAPSIIAEPRDGGDSPIGPESSCSECSVLRISNIPAGTANVDVNISLPNPGDTARVYGWNWVS